MIRKPSIENTAYTRTKILRDYPADHLFREKSPVERVATGVSGLIAALPIILVYGRDSLRRLNPEEINELKILLKLLASDQDWNRPDIITKVRKLKRTEKLARRQKNHKSFSFAK